MGGKGGECKCDNNTVVMVIKHGYTKEKHMAHLLWCLFFLEAKLNVTLVTTHVPGAKNLVADALSHNRLMEFFTLNSTGQAPAISGTTSPTAGPSQPARLVHQYIKCSLVPSTQHTYATAQRRYTKCLLSGTNPFPVSEHFLCGYSAYLASENLKASSIKGYLSACRQLQITLGLGDPFEKPLPLLEYVLKGIKSDQAKKMPAGRSRLPITPDILQRIWKVWNRDPGNPDLIMLWAACTTCFTGFLQSGEIVVPSAKEFDPGVHLSFGDVSPDNPEDPQVVQINIKASNTDPFRKGISVFLRRTNSSLCPVVAMAAYLASRKADPGPFFKFRDGLPLSRQKFVAKVREVLEEAGLDPKKYAGHSFRIGATTTAAARGVEDSVIKTLGRWQSSAYLLYV